MLTLARADLARQRRAAIEAVWDRWREDPQDEPRGPLRRWRDEQSREDLGLLRACLEHRFGAEVALGETTRLAGGESDIAMGGSA